MAPTARTAALVAAAALGALVAPPALASPVLRHRLIMRPEAELEGYGPDDAITTALASVPVPR